eukprot:COSAG02_NODE_1536_length_12051_cov_8.897674_9_plen_63_part_00
MLRGRKRSKGDVEEEGEGVGGRARERRLPRSPTPGEAGSETRVLTGWLLVACYAGYDWSETR